MNDKGCVAVLAIVATQDFNETLFFYPQITQITQIIFWKSQAEGKEKRPSYRPRVFLSTDFGFAALRCLRLKYLN
jgi:hypothetical protein